MIIDKKDCSGCSACAFVCPFNCISMTPDDEGFSYPVIDENICVNCNKCKDICPVFKEEDIGDFERKVFIVQHKDEKIRRESTSGGAFTAIAEYVIENGGVVFGASYDESFKVVHTSAVTKDELSKFRNSKYAQSDILASYNELKGFLEEGRLVLYSGTPCQIAGIKRVFGDYENLVTQDVVCHGIPSPLVFEKYIAFQRSRYSIFDKVYFRDKYSGYTHSTMSLYNNGKCLYHNGIEYDPMLKLFFMEMISRPVCSDCHFKTSERVSDFTLWDCFFPQKINPDFDDNKGTTHMLIHSKKGYEIFESIKDKIRFSEGNAKEICENSYEMNNSHKPNEKRETFFKDIKLLTAEELFNKYTPVTFLVKVEKVLRNIFAKLGIYYFMKNVYYKLKRGK